MSFFSDHSEGLDVLGAGAADVANYIPALSILSSLTSGMGGGDKKDGGAGGMGGMIPGMGGGGAAKPSEDTTKKDAAAEKLRQAVSKMQQSQKEAQREVARSRTILYSVLGVVGVAGVGVTTYLLTRR